MGRMNFKSLGIGFFAGVCLVFVMGAIGGEVLLRHGPYEIKFGTHAIAHEERGVLRYKEVPVCIKIDTRNGRTWRYATYLYYSKGYKLEGFERIPGDLKKSSLVPDPDPAPPADAKPCAPTEDNL
ncbi:MAG: hypothetical protein ACYSR6_07185 [Planctomycetota bacterium]|jgi:hypothetical protein